MNRYRLFRRQDQLCLQVEGEETVTPVRVVWARPVSGKGGEISFLNEKKKEVAYLPSLDQLDPSSRQIVEDELQRRYLSGRVLRVIRCWSHLGTRYFEVETDRGRRTFVIKSPNRDVTWITGDHLIIRDTLGNRYEIPSLSALDEPSRLELEKVI